MAKKKTEDKGIEATVIQNAKVMADLIIEPTTTDHLRVSIINKLLESKDNPDFFPTLFEEKMSEGDCPCCGIKLHWLIPEDNLNKMGWVTSRVYPQVPQETNKEDCPQWQEACKKKKVTV